MKYLFLSLIAALLLSVSWPTYGVPYFIMFALVPLLMMEHEIIKFSSYKRKTGVIFLLSYLCFIVWNTLTTGWLYGAKNPDGSHSMMAVLFPILVNSLLYALVFLFYHLFKKRNGTYLGLAFLVIFWVCFEKFHLNWELTWPWLNLGNVYSDQPKLIQWYDTLGAIGGSFWILISNIMGFYTIRIWEASRKRKSLILNSSIWLAIIIVPMLISYYKYTHFDVKSTGTANVLMLQPNVDPYAEKYSKDSVELKNELLALANSVKNVKIDYYIAPETALPGRGSFSETGLEKSTIISDIRNFLHDHPEAVFTTGASTHRFFFSEKDKPKEAYMSGDNTWVCHYNTALQISKEKTDIYHKGRLVPGVEIFPYMDVLKPILGNAMIDLGGTMVSLGKSKERSIFVHPKTHIKSAPIICYESIYGEYTSEYVKKGAQFLAIMTNDSWWGVSEGHRQLLSYARLRAIENRREIARAANSGISAHINALGEIEESTLYGDKTTLYSKIALYNHQTIYTKYGDTLYTLCLFLLGALLAYSFSKWIKRKP